MNSYHEETQSWRERVGRTVKNALSFRSRSGSDAAQDTAMDTVTASVTATNPIVEQDSNSIAASPEDVLTSFHSPDSLMEQNQGADVTIYPGLFNLRPVNPVVDPTNVPLPSNDEKPIRNLQRRMNEQIQLPNMLKGCVDNEVASQKEELIKKSFLAIKREKKAEIKNKFQQRPKNKDTSPVTLEAKEFQPRMSSQERQNYGKRHIEMTRMNGDLLLKKDQLRRMTVERDAVKEQLEKEHLNHEQTQARTVIETEETRTRQQREIAAYVRTQQRLESENDRKDQIIDQQTKKSLLADEVSKLESRERSTRDNVIRSHYDELIKNGQAREQELLYEIQENVRKQKEQTLWAEAGTNRIRLENDQLVGERNIKNQRILELNKIIEKLVAIQKDKSTEKELQDRRINELEKQMAEKDLLHLVKIEVVESEMENNIRQITGETDTMYLDKLWEKLEWQIRERKDAQAEAERENRELTLEKSAVEKALEDQQEVNLELQSQNDALLDTKWKLENVEQERDHMEAQYLAENRRLIALDRSYHNLIVAAITVGSCLGIVVIVLVILFLLRIRRDKRRSAIQKVDIQHRESPHSSLESILNGSHSRSPVSSDSSWPMRKTMYDEFGFVHTWQEWEERKNRKNKHGVREAETVEPSDVNEQDVNIVIGVPETDDTNAAFGVKEEKASAPPLKGDSLWPLRREIFHKFLLGQKQDTRKPATVEPEMMKEEVTDVVIEIPNNKDSDIVEFNDGTIGNDFPEEKELKASAPTREESTSVKENVTIC